MRLMRISRVVSQKFVDEVSPRGAGVPRRGARPYPLSRPRLTSSVRWLIIAFLLASCFPLWGQAPAAQHTPQEIQKLVQTASAALNRNDFPTAVQALKSLVEIDPRIVTAWFNLGYAHSALNRNE